MGNMQTSSADKQGIPETSSRSITTAHNFEVTGYSLLQGLGAGKFFSSSTFSISGYGWYILMYPDGRKEEEAAHMSVFLCYFRPSGSCWGWDKFIDKSKLQELLSHNDDGFTIRCVLTVIEEPHTEDESAVMVPVPESNLHTHFASMLKDGEGVDVTFSVDDQLFSAHRYVLAARSPVFKAQLFGPMKETTMKSIKIDDMEPAIFEALLHFIYTDSLPGNCDVDQYAASQHLLVAADRYGLDRLKTICEVKLCQKIDVQTVATTLALAEQHNFVQLKTACLRYLSSLDVLRVVKKTDGFRHLVASCPSIAMEILDKL